MKSILRRSLLASVAVAFLGLFAAPDNAQAERTHRRDRAFEKVLTLGRGFSVSAKDCGLSVTNQNATGLTIGCFQDLRLPSREARVTLKRNQYGILRAKDCALKVIAARSRFVDVRCVAAPPAQRFSGSVSCKLEGSAPKTRVWRSTKVFLENPVAPSGRTTPNRSKRAYAAQLGGLASTVGANNRSQITFFVKTSGEPNALEDSLDFKITAEPSSGRFNETGSWKFGVDKRGRVTLKGDSDAALTSTGSNWRAKCRWSLTAEKEPNGPIPVKMIEKRFAPPAGSLPAKTTPNTSAAVVDPGCGGVYTVGTDGQYAMLAVADMVPAASMVLGLGAVATSIVGGERGSSCLASSLDNINQQLAVQAYQIQQIETYLGLATNIFFSAWYTVQLQLENIEVKGWDDSLNQISPKGASPNVFGTFMEALGLWDEFLNPAAGAVTDSAQLAESLSPIDLGILQSQISAAEIAGFSDWIGDFSGTTVVLPNPTCTSNCSVQVTADSQSYLLLMLSQLFNTLKSNIDVYVQPTQQFNTVPNQNIVPLYEQYNTMLINFYQQALVSLQQAFTMEFLVNQINYFRAANTADKTQLSSFGQVAGTLYKYKNLSAAAEADAYNTAQRKLQKVYASRINQLYENILNFVVTDVPVSPQAYPTAQITLSVDGQPYTADPIDYLGEVGKSLPNGGSGVQGKTVLSILPQVTGGLWNTAAALYQFSGLKDVATCISSLEAYNDAVGTAGGTLQEWLDQNPSACPSIFALADGSALDQGFYDGNTLAPYTSFQPASKTTGGPMVLTGKMTNNLRFCDPTSPALGWYVPTGSAVGNAAGMEANKVYLNCGRWYTPGKSSCGFPKANCAAGNNTTSSNPYDKSSWHETLINIFPTDQGCTNNLSINGNNYPWILTLTNGLPTGLRSCSSAVISVTAPSGVKQSPIFSGSRSESGNFNSGSQDGCSVGFFGTGISNRLPRLHEGPGTASFGMRLPNVSDSGGAGAGSGWVIPFNLEAYCVDSRPDTFLYAPYDLADWGVSCVDTAGDSLRCVIPDGTTYQFDLSINGNAPALNVSTVP